MKLATVPNTVEITGAVVGPTNFSINFSAKAFKVLSDTMYQDKVGSIVRELSCNAVDSHVSAGKSAEPFLIHVPDGFEPWFSVIDYGTGLTPDAMVNVFTKYFESTKDNSNDMIGAFGLGSKSWASYTDQATIISVTNGIERTYSAFISSQGMPAIIEMASREVDACNGVEVRIAVRADDYKEFRDAVAKQLRFFTVKPKIDNYPDFKFEVIDDELELQSKSIDIRKTKNHYGNSGTFFVIQGQVGYPLDIPLITAKLAKSNVDEVEFMKALKNAGTIHLNFDIGEIEVTASREGISYTDYTIANIAKKLAQAKVEVQDEIADKIAGFTRQWDVAAYLNSNPTVAKFAALAKVQLDGVKEISGKYLFDGRSLCVDSTDPNHLKYRARIFSHQVGAVRSAMCTGFEIYPKDKMVILVRDTGKSPVARIREYVAKHSVDAIEFNAVEENLFTDEYVKSLSDIYGGVDIYKVSELDLIEKKRAARAKYARSTYYTLNTTRKMTLSTGSWDKQLAPLEQIATPTVYVLFENRQIKATLSQLDCFKATSTLPLIAVRPEDVKKLPSGCLELEPLVSAKIKEIQSDKHIKAFFKYTKLAQVFNDRGFNAFVDEPTVQKNVTNKVIKGYIHKRNRVNKILDGLRKTQYDSYVLDIAAKTFTLSDKEFDAMHEYTNNVYKQFPLVGDVAYWKMSDRVKHLIVYVNALDKAI